mmetsp:Transcript_37118/g.40234  ORF Transcript_37118/g.40234 Transcript_37118/m.40234 type:complete len:99 (+) Transcript_37118:79-375(+)
MQPTKQVGEQTVQEKRQQETITTSSSTQHQHLALCLRPVPSHLSSKEKRHTEATSTTKRLVSLEAPSRLCLIFIFMYSISPERSETRKFQQQQQQQQQ